MRSCAGFCLLGSVRRLRFPYTRNLPQARSGLYFGRHFVISPKAIFDPGSFMKTSKRGGHREIIAAYMCGTEHIREVIPFPRMLYRVYPEGAPARCGRDG